MGAPPVSGQALISVTLPLRGVEPEALLRPARGEPRGFWAREGRWFAHRGVVAEVSASDPLPPAGGRFRMVAGAAREILGAVGAGEPGRDAPPPRLFGGFSFLDDHPASHPWEAFPSARFLLPELELVGGAEGGTLTLRGRVAGGEAPGQARERLEARLDAARDALLAGTAAPAARRPPLPSPHPETEPEAWNRAVCRILEAVEEGALSKAVLARALTLTVQEELDPAEVALSLWRRNPGSHVFLYEPTPGHALMGAAPETVATVREGRFRATAVAGSVGVGSSPGERASLAARLLASEKDLREHRICVRDMLERLGPVSADSRAAAEPRVLSLSAIQHLETPIEAELREGESVLSVLEALHPTPAVCGYPRDPALELLRQVEPFQRGWYAGPVGWVDEEGNGVFVPALRSALVRGREWRLFAGAGIVAGSVPEQEWEETRIKFEPVLRALGGDDA